MNDSLEIAILAAILFGALLAFAWQKFRVELVAMGVLIFLVLTGLLSVSEALSGFSSPAVITVGAVLVISRGLVQSGVATSISRAIRRTAGNEEACILALVMAAAGLTSAFMNDVGATAVLLPAVIDVARRTKISASRLLVPLSFATLLGGSTTLIGTPCNILVSEYLVTRGLEPFSFFEFAPAGIAAAAAGIMFMACRTSRSVSPRRMSRQDTNPAGFRPRWQEHQRHSLPAGPAFVHCRDPSWRGYETRARCVRYPTVRRCAATQRSA
jgi:di/tricarboxylate transporter